MSTMKRRSSMTALLMAAMLAGLFAQDKMADVKAIKGIQGSFVRQSMSTEKKLTSLAEAVPQDKFNWRPTEGVRSIAESFLHSAVGNYLMVRMLGGKLPEGLDLMKLEKSTTDKAKVVEEVTKSFKAVNDCIGSIPDADLTKEVSFFGTPMSENDVIMAAADHQHEVLGQAIAYARMNQIVPPWTAARQAKMKSE